MDAQGRANSLVQIGSGQPSEPKVILPDPFDGKPVPDGRLRVDNVDFMQSLSLIHI